MEVEMKIINAWMMTLLLGAVLFVAGIVPGCGSGTDGEKGKRLATGDDMKIIFLHHSTGKVIWDGGVKKWFKDFNRTGGNKYDISEMEFPREKPYGWNNYPYDYWNIWVNHGGAEKFMNEPTLEILTKKYDLIIFKHCFPVSEIMPDTGTPDIASSEKRLENYKLQYGALRDKMRSFPETKFLVWTGAALVRQRSDEEKGAAAKEFARWVLEEWDEPGDNIFVWDFFGLETEGGIFLQDKYAKSETNSHPDELFAQKAAPLFCRRIVDVMEGRGDSPR
jgi:hypothetical protein